jgi:hypothetical protein
MVILTISGAAGAEPAWNPTWYAAVLIILSHELLAAQAPVEPDSAAKGFVSSG